MLLFKEMWLFLNQFLNIIVFLSGTLLAELREYNLEQQRRAQADLHSPDAPPEDSSITARLKGKMKSRLAMSMLGKTSFFVLWILHITVCNFVILCVLNNYVYISLVRICCL